MQNNSFTIDVNLLKLTFYVIIFNLKIKFNANKFITLFHQLIIMIEYNFLKICFLKLSFLK